MLGIDLLAEDTFEGQIRSGADQGARAADVGRVGHRHQHAGAHLVEIAISIRPAKRKKPSNRFRVPFVNCCSSYRWSPASRPSVDSVVSLTGAASSASSFL